MPQWITIDLGEVYNNVTQLRYFLNTYEWTARILQHEILVGEDGTNFTPAFSQYGSCKVTFTAAAGTLSSSMDVNITVNKVMAQALTAALTGYVNGLKINKIMKNLLVKQIKDVTGHLDKGKYKQAMIKLKVFMLEVRILQPLVLTSAQADYILHACLDIITAIGADAQGKDKNWADSKVRSLIDTIEKFKSVKATDIFDSIMRCVDDLTNKMR